MTTKSKSAIDKKILALDRSIKKMPAIELTFNDIAELFGYKPSVPRNNAYTRFYGLTSHVRVSGEDYEVFEIVAYSATLGKPSKNPLYSEGTVNLLEDGKYTVSDFAKTVSATFDYVLQLKYVPYTLARTIFDPFDFDSSATTHSLDLNYKAQQIVVYAYVTSSGGTWYDHMQPSQRVTITKHVEVAETKYGMIEGDIVHRANQDLASQYYADVNRPARRYHNYDFYLESDKIGPIRYNFPGGYPRAVNLPYYRELSTIPGAN